MRILFPAFLLLLAACGPKDTDPGPGGVTVGEARALDQAAAMLEQQHAPGSAQAPGAGDKQAAPAPGPSASPGG